jgi:drug/metabolite transporter (DMT)-like permease
MYPLIRFKKLNPLGPKPHRKILFFRSVVGTIGLLCFFFAYKFLDPSDAASLFHSSVIMIALLARIVLKEKLSFFHIFALLFTIIGVFFISKPETIFKLTKAGKNFFPVAINFYFDYINC